MLCECRPRRCSNVQLLEERSQVVDQLVDRSGSPPTSSLLDTVDALTLVELTVGPQVHEMNVDRAVPLVEPVHIRIAGG